ncbi:MAG: N-6 DNA methylase [Candidatus Eisenbacteria sp.]|nr:N-6 DNA methylase [Candidatus Eisenbacteria bacterium]
MTVATLDSAFQQVGKLVDLFQANEARYLSADYQEAEVRKDFIDKFFIALGWDVNHDHQTNPYEQEVKVEPSVSAAGQRRADYSFCLAPNFRDVRFFVEAKKPRGDIATNHNYFQAIRYGWNNETPFAVLTDFEQFHVLDCRYKPDLAAALNRCVSKYHYTDYTKPEKFAEIYWLFSHEALAGGSLEKRAKALPKPRGKAIQRGRFAGGHQSVDESFLQELDEYRTTLARAFKRKNPQFDSATLTELAQRTLDRLVFLRFLEDKGIEAQRLVDRFGEKGTAWEDFVTASRRLDSIYNGIVFKQHGILDVQNLPVDDDAFANICKRLAHVNSPYDFNAIPIHILGSIYERFLGKVIVATDKRARVEDKPEVRKAGGVYYTPEYIVRYIIENTIGKLIAGKTPNQIAKMRFADIACGSGSFLLAVYDLLLQYHGNYYNANPKKAKMGTCIQRDGKLYLSLRKKREILLNNIYGVDIDPQAVEVCQFSLYLRLLQEETEASAYQYLLDFQKQALLPSLSKNIVCGNSLIGTDILEGKLFGSDEERKLNPLDFEDAFPEVARRGGFNAIIGNPPYVRMEGFVDIKDYLRTKYATHSDRSDIYYYFMERAVNLLCDSGRLGFIVSNTFTRSRAGESLRGFLTERLAFSSLVEFGDFTPFAAATVYPVILIASKTKARRRRIPFIVQDCDPQANPSIQSFPIAFQLDRKALAREGWVFEDAASLDLRTRLLTEYPSLLALYGPARMGVKTGFNKAFLISESDRKRILAKNAAGKNIIKPYVAGEDLDRYAHRWHDQWMIYATHGLNASKYPAVIEHMEPFKSALKARATKQNWFELQQPQEAYSDLLDKPKIMYPDMSRYPKFSLDSKGLFFSNTVYFIASESLYLLGLLNSKLLWFVIRGLSNALRGGLWRFRLFSRHIERLPIRRIDLASPADKACHDQMVAKVEAMLEAKRQLAKALTDRDKTYYENKCASLDRQIDRRVYDLYDLTDEEIKIVEEGGG